MRTNPCGTLARRLSLERGMFHKPEDLLDREPESFVLDEHRRAAMAFKQAWNCITAHAPSQKHQETRLWLAELVLERAKWHTTVESLRNEVVRIAISEVLPKLASPELQPAHPPYS